MNDQDNQENAVPAQIPVKSSAELLNAVNLAASNNMLKTIDLSISWSDLKNAVNPSRNEQNFVALQMELEEGKQTWIKNLIVDWIDPANLLEKNEFARLGAIRLLASIAGRNPNYADSVFNSLWSVIKDEKFTVDARAWALFSIHFCDVIMDASHWNETFGQVSGAENGGASGEYWLESVSESKVRARAVQALGEMANYSGRARCWNPAQREQCLETLDRCRLADDRFNVVEDMLVSLWSREIDYSVTFRLVEAIGHAAGWSSRLPQADQWAVIGLLSEAAIHNDARTKFRVPGAVQSIGSNLIYRQDLSLKQRLDAISKLVDLAVDAVNKLQQGAEKKQYSAGYDLQRQYLLTMRNIAIIANEVLPPNQAAEVTYLVVIGLFKIADSQIFQDNTMLRRLALHFLKELAITNTRTSQLALEKYKLMLADFEPSVVKNVALNMVTLLKENEAANYFVEIIIEDKLNVLGAAIAHRKKKWNGSTGDEQILKIEGRMRLAEVLGSISDNSAAHDELVKTLRSDALRSGRARDALIVMGGERAVESIVNYNLQQQVTDRFFKPMEEARERGWMLLENVQEWANDNYKYAYRAALAAMWVGIAIFIIGAGAVIFSIFSGNTDSLNWQLIIAPIIGLLLTLGGGVGTYLWEPAKGLNKVASELTRLIMSFENYLGRMRLIGLGFAHAYTQNSFDQLRFLRRISEISADAMRESALSLEAIGDWPDFEVDSQYATVPTLLDKSLTEARQLADRAKLKLEVGDPEYDGDKEINTVIDQKPAPGLYVSKDTKIRVTPSTNKLPNVEVPDFTAKTVLEAIELAQQKGFEIEPIDFEFSDAEEGNVINQDLRAGLNVTMRTTLKLTVAKKKEVVDEDGT